MGDARRELTARTVHNQCFPPAWGPQHAAVWLG